MNSLLLSRTWWKDASKRALYTAIAIAVPYLGVTLVTSVPWLTMLLAASLGFVASLGTSLAGLPESSGVDLPWWLAALERVVKTFCQALVAGFVGATLITDVAWSTVLQSAAISALLSLLRLIMATLPADPTRLIDAGIAVPGAPVSITAVTPSTSDTSIPADLAGNDSHDGDGRG